MLTNEQTELRSFKLKFKLGDLYWYNIDVMHLFQIIGSDLRSLLMDSYMWLSLGQSPPFFHGNRMSDLEECDRTEEVDAFHNSSQEAADEN